MPQLCIRLRDEDKQKLDELEARLGKNTTEVVRDLIQIGYDRQTLNKMLTEVRTALANISGQKAAADIAEIRRIVTLIGRAMPAVSKYIS
jgi:predicted DNA-binding protein